MQAPCLFTEVRDKRSLYGVSSELRAYRKGRSVATTVSTNDRVAESLAVAREHILRMPRDGIGEAELADDRTWLKGAFVPSLDWSGAIAAVVHNMLPVVLSSRTSRDATA